MTWKFKVCEDQCEVLNLCLKFWEMEDNFKSKQSRKIGLESEALFKSWILPRGKVKGSEYSLYFQAIRT